MSPSDRTLIRSKLLVPIPTNLLHRPAVCQAMKAGLDSKLTLVSAPAGYGKTSALVDFARHSPIPVCWYTVDERDRDLTVFIDYLVGAIGEQFGGFGARTQAALADLEGELFRDPAAIVADLANEILTLDTPFVLIVDNFEAVDGALGVREFLHRLLEVQPANCHLMLGSRVLPDVPVTRLVAKRQLVGLTAENLRFTDAEIRDLLALADVECTPEQVEAIVSRSEGWITGVLLLADLLREDAAGILRERDVATVDTYAYLTAEVLSRQPPHVLDFLYASSVLREMSVRLCRDVLGIQYPQSLLEEVQRRNLFVTRFGQGSTATYRYHSLFRHFLAQRFRQRDLARYQALHRAAADRFEAQNRIEEAVHHYLSAEAYPQATALMDRVAMEWFWRGRVEALLRWGERLPEEMHASAPRLALYRGKVFTDRYESEAARKALSYADAGFTARRDMTSLAVVRNQQATLDLYAAKYRETIERAEEALQLIAEGDLRGQSEAQRLIGIARVRLGDLEAGIERLQEALAWFREAGSSYDVVNLLLDLTMAYASLGRFDDAARCLGEALSVARRLGAPTQLAIVLNNLGSLHSVRGEYRDALAVYEEGLAVARRAGDLRVQASTAEGIATIYRNVGAYQRAEPLYETAWRITRESEPSVAIYYRSMQAEMYRWQGEMAEAFRLLEQARDMALEKGLDFQRRGPLTIAEGVTRVAAGQVERGLALLTAGVEFLEQRQSKSELAQAYFLLAEAYLLSQDRPAAVAALRRALALAEEIGTDQFAVVEGQHVPALLELGVSEGLSHCRILQEKVAELRSLRAVLLRDGTGEETRGEGALEIYAFGEGRVVRDGRAISSSAWKAAMAKELFFYILLHGPLERDALGLVFWPDLSTKRMTDSFHSTLYRVRRAVGGDAVINDGGVYRIGDLDYWFDVAEFEALVQRARLLPPHDWQAEDLWRRAVRLYADDFLADVDRLWALSKREALREMYLEALVALGRCYETRRAFEEAIRWYKQALAVDDLREDVHRRVMRCYAAAGRRSAALAQYQTCREILARDLGVAPMEETERLYHSLADQA